MSGTLWFGVISGSSSLGHETLVVECRGVKQSWWRGGCGGLPHWENQTSKSYVDSIRIVDFPNYNRHV